jgi:hypothetical protein
MGASQFLARNCLTLLGEPTSTSLMSANSEDTCMNLDKGDCGTHTTVKLAPCGH